MLDYFLYSYLDYEYINLISLMLLLQLLYFINHADVLTSIDGIVTVAAADTAMIVNVVAVFVAVYGASLSLYKGK